MRKVKIRKKNPKDKETRIKVANKDIDSLKNILFNYINNIKSKRRGKYEN